MKYMLVAAFFAFWAWYEIWSRSKLKRTKANAGAELEAFYASLKGELGEYQLYVLNDVGRPFEISAEELERQIIETCEYHQIGMPFSFIRPAQYCIKVDEESKQIYAATYVADFDIGKNELKRDIAR
ncbi:hypothetical protein EY643_16775 [Halioglobus maricola]|uniref:Uncharacterized protein n=1 Tax=Halioglobus maricola TaxID=2601894 RepID=A0A5P9NNV8_9GAMM|nr:hypothetical protein [Halioglobus maricola]QFU77176.1 hypothetical protein EY643_16775 [Halioglobus maricola]